MVLWNTGYFDDLRLEIEDGEIGKVIRFLVTERRVVRTIRYEGNKSATLSDILERFKERNVGLTVESRYDPTTVNRAVFVLRELLGERGRQYAEVNPEVRQIPPASVEIVFNIDEGPKVKVGDVSFDGLNVMSRKNARRAMKNTKPLGIPRSFVLENIFTRTFDIRKLEEDKERLRNAYQKRGYFKANVLRHELDIRDSPGRGTFLIPWSMIFNKPKKHADINLLVEEGPRYSRGKLSFTDVELFRVPDQVLGPVFAMQEGCDLRHREAAQGHGEPQEALRRVRLHRLRRRARLRVPRGRVAAADRPEPGRRRGQAVLCAPHRVRGQQHDPRQGHPARVA